MPCHILFCVHLQFIDEHWRKRDKTTLCERTGIIQLAPPFLSHLYLSANRLMRWTRMPWGVRSVQFWLSSIAREQLSQHDAAAGSKQAESADSVNHSFTPSKLWWMRQRLVRVFPLLFFSFFLFLSQMLKIFSTPLVPWTEATYPGPLE